MIPYRGGGFFTSLPPVIKNLLIINALMLVITYFAEDFMYGTFSLFFFESELFRPFQFVTHMFMHGGIFHLFFNMYSLVIFGVVLEHVWGSQKFFLYYMVTGLGAAALHSLVLWIDYSSQVAAFEAGNQYALQNIQTLLATPTVGASGAVYGVLLAYGMLFPNNVLQLIFPPIALKAKWFVLIFGALELWLGISNTGGNIAHFAHLGGMLFGFILIKYWKKNNKMYF
ncbi:MAG: rhomboid family intramembrane serine protease [Bacteroidales bacterium]|jgi:membrane associated rhomboid family serine protease|nr:rhomboid family intramembrane serine protease [Bacteroidales bacterium]